MMDTKQLLQVLEGLGKNSRKVNSLAASEVSEDSDNKCVQTLRNIIDNNKSSTNKSLAASAAAANPKVNRVRVLTDFIFRNGKI